MALVIVQEHTLPAELFFEHTVHLGQVLDYALLFDIDPASEGQEQDS